MTMTLISAGIFSKVNDLTLDATGSVKLVIALGAIIFIGWRWVEKRTLTAVITAGLIAGIAMWLVYGGIDTFREKVGQDLASAPTSVSISASDVSWDELSFNV